LREEAQDQTLWRTQFASGYGPVTRQSTTWSWLFLILHKLDVITILLKNMLQTVLLKNNNLIN
jgi:hypothetical protein